MTDVDVFEKACANKERIWWTENDEIVQYDFKSGNIKRTNDTTKTDKSGLIEDGLVQIDHEDNALLLFDEKSGHRIRITFEEFAEMSDKTDELMQSFQSRRLGPQATPDMGIFNVCIFLL